MAQIYLKQRPAIAMILDITLDEFNEKAMIAKARNFGEIEVIVVDWIDEADNSDWMFEKTKEQKARVFFNIEDVLIRCEPIPAIEKLPEGSTED